MWNCEYKRLISLILPLSSQLVSHKFSGCFALTLDGTARQPPWKVNPVIFKANNKFCWYLNRQFYYCSDVRVQHPVPARSAGTRCWRSQYRDSRWRSRREKSYSLTLLMKSISYICLNYTLMISGAAFCKNLNYWIAPGWCDLLNLHHKTLSFSILYRF